jgi:hypothetical protein
VLWCRHGKRRFFSPMASVPLVCFSEPVDATTLRLVIMHIGRRG